MKRMQILVSILPIGYFSILAGCASSPVRMYAGPARPPEEVAIIQADPALWRFSLNDCNRPASHVELLPGQHVYAVALCTPASWTGHARWPHHWDAYLYTEVVNLEFESVAGHRYHVGFNLWLLHDDGLRESYRWPGLLPLPRSGQLSCDFQVFDSITGEIVACASVPVKNAYSIYCPYATHVGK